MAAEIAAALGDGWTTPHQGRGFTSWLEGPDRITLALTLDTLKEPPRWVVAGRLTRDEQPHTTRHSDPAPRPKSISVEGSATPEHLAREIRRRYLDAWIAHAHAARDQMARRDASRARVIAAGDRLLAALGDRGRWRPREHITVAPGQLDPGRSEITVGQYGDPLWGLLSITDWPEHGTTTTYLAMTMSAQEAEAVVTFLAERARVEGAPHRGESHP